MKTDASNYTTGGDSAPGSTGAQRVAAGREEALKAVARRSPWLLRLWSGLNRWAMARQFGTVRLWRDPEHADLPEEPILVVANHPTGWEGPIYLLLTQVLADREHYAVAAGDGMGWQGLRKWKRLRQRVGYLPIERGSVRGAEAFLMTSLALLERPRSMLWIAAQGHIADPRRRPAGLQSGIGHLAKRLGRGYVWPLAIDYGFWNGRQLELFLRFGELVPLGGTERQSSREWIARIEEKFEANQDELARAVIQRKRNLFETILERKPLLGHRLRKLFGSHQGTVRETGTQPAPPESAPATPAKAGPS